MYLFLINSLTLLPDNRNSHQLDSQIAMLQLFKELITDLEKQIEQLEKKDNRFSILRLITFSGFFISLVFALESRAAELFLAPFVLLLGFIGVLLWHNQNLATLRNKRTRKEIFENERACLQYQPNAYYQGAFFYDPEHDFSSDMDAFGKNSLFAYVNRAATGVGNQALAQWLTEKSSKEEILQRQAAVKELAARPDWCIGLRIQLFEKRIRDFQKENLPAIEKTVSPPKPLPFLVWLSRGILLASVLLIAFNAIHASILTVPLMVNIIINWYAFRYTQTIKVQLEGRERTLNEYYKILTELENQSWESEYLKAMQDKLSEHGAKASHAIRQLRQLSQKLDYSLNMALGAVLNYFFLWDIAIGLKISRWFDGHAEKTAQWFTTSGQLEALISLANIENNHPAWTYPLIHPSEKFIIRAREAGHPLINEKQRVCNDFTMESHNTISMITGSNMAGKSTFLRTLGVNIVLAHAGAPVCATQMEISHFPIMTYLTITDSLSENTSTFYREIKRLKKILDTARANHNTLLLLDEMLRGTNSADKARGSMAITRELIRHHIPAVIATHNLELAEMQKEFPENINNYFFDIIIEPDSTMRFDYKLKPGICNTFNASLLLREIGIDVG